jgi:hypothetical protein
MILTLIRYGAHHWNTKNGEGQTPLMIMAKENLGESVQTLLDTKCVRPLMNNASNDCDTKAITPLTNHVINACDNEGRTPLMNAAFYGASSVVDILLSYKASVETPTFDGPSRPGPSRPGPSRPTALILAMGPKLKTYCTLRSETRGEINHDSVYHNPKLDWNDIWDRRSTVVESLLKYPSVKDGINSEYKERTALTQAASLGATKSVQLLLDAKASVSRCTCDEAVRNYIYIYQLFTYGSVTIHRSYPASTFAAFETLIHGFIDTIYTLQIHDRDTMESAIESAKQERSDIAGRLVKSNGEIITEWHKVHSNFPRRLVNSDAKIIADLCEELLKRSGDEINAVNALCVCDQKTDELRSSYSVHESS